jgi:hypothetical protein
MTDKRFHMGWFMNFTTNEWNSPSGSHRLSRQKP